MSYELMILLRHMMPDQSTFADKITDLPTEEQVSSTESPHQIKANPVLSTAVLIGGMAAFFPVLHCSVEEERAALLEASASQAHLLFSAKDLLAPAMRISLSSDHEIQELQKFLTSLQEETKFEYQELLLRGDRKMTPLFVEALNTGKSLQDFLKEQSISNLKSEPSQSVKHQFALRSQQYLQVVNLIASMHFERTP